MTTSELQPPPALPTLPRTERNDAPAYLQRYLEREGQGGKPHEIVDRGIDKDTPLYLRRFRDRRSGANPLEAPVPEWEGVDLGVTQARARMTKTKEIVPPDAVSAGPKTLTQVHIIRHGETQGYSTESGLTPLGGWQAHRRGFDISKGVREGERIRIVCAETNRARQTAEHLRRGLLDGLTMWGRTAEVSEIDGMEEFRNFQVWTPEGLRDVTGAFRLYQKEMEKYERVAHGDRPVWLVEVDRFWRTQQGGGDPITYWTQIPMLCFEPPSATVRRFWAGIRRIQQENPGDRFIVATHSGPIRVFAMAAHGYDPGEPYNTEEVIVKLMEGDRGAFLAYRNRVSEVQVPQLSELPDWWEGLSGEAVPTSLQARGGAFMTSHIMWFEGYWDGLKLEVGGKAASLGEMTGAGLPVPPGYALTTSAYRVSRDAADLDATLARLLHGLDTRDTDMVTDRCGRIRTHIAEMPMGPDVEESLRQAYDELCRRSSTDDVPVAVRSSATSEDSPDASFAGEHDTYLWVRGADAVVDAVRRCWASLFTDRATCYRVEMGYEHRSVEMSVVVQKMVRPISAGVAFTLNPSDGDRSTIAIDAAWGFGEGVVSGEVTPDNFLVDKVLYEISRRKVAKKEVEFTLDGGDHVVKKPLEGSRATDACLTDAQIKAIARLARTAERHYGCPQDIEWAVDADLPDGENVVLLQSRPETVWSKKVADSPTTTGGADMMASIVSTLMNPLNSRKS